MTCRGFSALLCAGLTLCLGAVTSSATNTATTPSSLLRYPLVEIDEVMGTDTVITIANTDDVAVNVRCFYVDSTPRCSGDGSCLRDSSECVGICTAEQTALEFSILLGPLQPTGWRASAGREEIPSVGLATGLEGSEARAVPALGSTGFRGSLLCLATGADGLPIAADVLIGSAALETRGGGNADWATYEAFGLAASAGGPSGAAGTILGGPSGELAGCPAAANLPILFDAATLESAAGDTRVFSRLAIAPCAVDLTGGFAPQAVQFVVFNEFAQRLITSTPLRGHLVRRLALLDTLDPNRSIFSVGVTGTISGEVGIRVVDVLSGAAGFVAVALETHRAEDESLSTSAFAPSYGRSNTIGDLVALPVPVCAGDCNGNRRVTIAELITGVNIALGRLPATSCSDLDRDGDGQVVIADLVAAVSRALHGCPNRPSLPTPVPTPTPRVIQPAADGPEIAYFGVASADGFAQVAESFDAEDRPIYNLPHGQGFSLVVELLPGLDGRPPGPSAYSESGDLPDLQLIVSRPLGDGSSEVCDVGRDGGGVPASQPFEFGDSEATRDAINDLGCRVDDGLGDPKLRSTQRLCTRGDQPGEVAAAQRQSVGQFCLPIARAWAFAPGDTVVAARGRDVNGTLGATREIVVRVRADR